MISGLHPGEEGEDDRGEGRDEIEPLLRVQVEGVAGNDAERELDERDGDAELDREHARDENHCGENCGELNRLHVCLHFASVTFGRGHQPGLSSSAGG